MKQFTLENTRDFTQNELDRMNEEFESMDFDHSDEQLVKANAEKILDKYC